MQMTVQRIQERQVTTLGQKCSRILCYGMKFPELQNK